MTTRRIIVGLLLAVTCTHGWGLGLGELDLRSALNERFDADIELFDAAELEATEIRVALATPEDFEKVGVERFFFLTTLDFEVVKGPRGAPVIKVSSTQAISEPYLNFIVEVLWPTGRMLREYTVLLDPPTFTEAVAPSVAAPQRTPPPPDAGSPGARAGSPNRATVPSRPSAARSTSGSGSSQSGMTGRNDTLWQIAQDALPAADVTVPQNMLAIKRLNPQAFIADNVNQLKAGYVLRMPTAAQARELSADAAQQRVVLENEAWRSGRSLPTAPAGDGASELKAQVDATAAKPTAASAAGSADGQLRIVAGDGDSAQGGAASEGGTSTAPAASAEERDRLSRELDELTYKMERELEQSTAEITVKERQLEVKDQQIADLQAQLTAAREEMARLQQAQAASPEAAAAAAVAASRPWWQSTLALGGAALGLVALAIGGLLVARRRREATDDEFYGESEALEPQLAAGDESAMTVTEEPWATAEDDDVADAFERATVDTDESPLALDGAGAAPAVTAAAEDFEGSETGDVVGEAEIYIAYGRYPQAITLLSGALAADPDRHDVRCKLLELYTETNDRASFESQYQELTAGCSDGELLTVGEQLLARLNEQEDEISLDELDGDAAGDAASSVAGSGDDADLADFDLDAPGDDEERPTLDLSVAELDSDFGAELDEDSTLEALYTPESGASPLAAAEDDALSLAELEAEFDADSEFNVGDDAGIAGVDDMTELDDDFGFELELDDSLADDSDADDESAGVGSGGGIAALSSASAADQLGGDLGLEFDPDRQQGADAATNESAANSESFSAAGLEEQLLDLDEILDSADSDTIVEAGVQTSADTTVETRQATALHSVVSPVAATTAAEAAMDAVPELGATAAPAPSAAAEEDFDFDDDDDGTATKLDLARAYIDMGDQDGARDILHEVLNEGSDAQQVEAQELLATI